MARAKDEAGPVVGVAVLPRSIRRFQGRAGDTLVVRRRANLVFALPPPTTLPASLAIYCLPVAVSPLHARMERGRGEARTRDGEDLNVLPVRPFPLPAGDPVAPDTSGHRGGASPLRLPLCTPAVLGERPWPAPPVLATPNLCAGPWMTPSYAHRRVAGMCQKNDFLRGIRRLP